MLLKVDPTRFKLPPYKHQFRGTKTLLAKDIYGLFWQMRLGKTKAVIDAACILFEAGLLKNLIIACPAQVKNIWINKEVGEARKHCWVDYQAREFNSDSADYIDMLMTSNPGLNIVAVSDELLRQDDRKGDFPQVYKMAEACQGPTWLTFDEASAFGSHKSQQTKAALHLRNVLKPKKVTTLDGTPVGNHPVEQYSKFKLLDERILGYKNWFHFRATHQVSEASVFAAKGRAYSGFKNQEYIDRKVRPYCEYLEQKDCLDMPEKVTTFLTAALKPKTWRIYQEMRDELVADLDSGMCEVRHAAVKSMRLAQICAGYIGGVENEETGEMTTVELSEEATDEMIDWLKRHHREDPAFKCVVWCRWRPEIERLCRRIVSGTKLPYRVVYGQKRDYHDELHPDHPYQGPLVLVAQAQALKYGTNLSKAASEFFLSQDYNLVTRQQAEERVQAPKSQTKRQTTLVGEVLVTGPQGQKTVTWDIKRSLQEKEMVATRTVAEWKRILTEE